MNISQKHTPGPWIADLRTGCFAILKQTDKRTCLSGADDDAIVYQKGRVKESSPGAYRYLTDEQEANARLIAAAPEMLAALEAAKKFIEDHLPFGRYCTVEEYKSRVNKVMTPIEAAISKAMGTNQRRGGVAAQ